MNTISLTIKGGIAILRLDNGVPNAVSPLLVNELTDALGEIRNDCSGMILAGNDKFFSMGLDLPSLIELDRIAMSEFMREFDNVTLRLFRLSLPTIAVLSGHAVAGGFVLASTCDFRYSDTPDSKCGLNEIKLGVPVPYVADLILRQIVGNRTATSLIYAGDFVPISKASEIGFVDKLCLTESAENAAIDRLTRISGSDSRAFASVKSTRTDYVARLYETNGARKREEFLDCWFSDNTRKRLLEASEKF